MTKAELQAYARVLKLMVKNPYKYKDPAEIERLKQIIIAAGYGEILTHDH